MPKLSDLSHEAFFVAYADAAGRHNVSVIKALAGDFCSWRGCGVGADSCRTVSVVA